MNIVRIFGKVTKGRKIGSSKLGFPTANIAILDTLNEKDGVYAGHVILERKTYDAVINVGSNPSVIENGERRIEAHIFDFNRDIYGCEIEVDLIEYIRDEHKFDSLEQLAEQITKDKAEAKKILNKYSKQQ